MPHSSRSLSPYHPSLFSLCRATEKPKSEPSGPPNTAVGDSSTLNAERGTTATSASSNAVTVGGAMASFSGGFKRDSAASGKNKKVAKLRHGKSRSFSFSFFHCHHLRTITAPVVVINGSINALATESQNPCRSSSSFSLHFTSLVLLFFASCSETHL